MPTIYDMLELDALPSNGDVLGVPGTGSDVEFLLTETFAEVPDDYYSTGLGQWVYAGFHVSSGTFPATIDGVSYATTGHWDRAYIPTSSQPSHLAHLAGLAAGQTENPRFDGGGPADAQTVETMLSGSRPRTWTGGVVSLGECRSLSDWERNGCNSWKPRSEVRCGPGEVVSTSFAAFYNDNSGGNANATLKWLCLRRSHAFYRIDDRQSCLRRSARCIFGRFRSAKHGNSSVAREPGSMATASRPLVGH